MPLAAGFERIPPGPKAPQWQRRFRGREATNASRLRATRSNGGRARSTFALWASVTARRIRDALRGEQHPSADDLAVIDAFRSEYVPLVVFAQVLLAGLVEVTEDSDAWREVVPALEEQGYERDSFLSVASRPKTSEAIVAKLGRESTRLSQMQDIVGGRIILPDTLLQDTACNAIRRLTEDSQSGIELFRDVSDTREYGDEHGYRAVHVVLVVDGKPVELQIRTAIQQAWAQLVEGLDQKFDWDLKHGQGPEDVADWLREVSRIGALLDAGELFDDFEARLPLRPVILDT